MNSLLWILAFVAATSGFTASAADRLAHADESVSKVSGSTARCISPLCGGGKL